ncbi:immunity 41 family protein [Paenibacillus lautus]|uniref:Imm41 family immunity protein n=1 Tax=Bacillales TaxID=1385 RepID=UPI00203FE257|nr:Imm41 family immunity protein [Paenibacillus lautus]MCM3257301.1 immunity 41 family protein [Paenibacillus lautus]
MTKVYQILEDNYELIEGTFMYSLIEEARFHEDHFWDYYNDAMELVKDRIKQELDKELTKKLIWTYKRIMECFLCHHDDRDIYEMTNYPGDKDLYYLERLSFMIDGYFNDYVMSEKQFGSEIKNPKYKELYKYEKEM